MKSDKWIIWLSALGAYSLALIGAIGFAILLKFDLTTTLIFVGAIAIIALFGSALPMAQLVRTRLQAHHTTASLESSAGVSKHD